MQIFQNFFLYLFPRVIIHSEWEIGHSYTTETPSVVTPGTGSSSIVGLNDLWPLMLMPVWQGKYYKPGSGLKKKNLHILTGLLQFIQLVCWTKCCSVLLLLLTFLTKRFCWWLLFPKIHLIWLNFIGVYFNSSSRIIINPLAVASTLIYISGLPAERLSCSRVSFCRPPLLPAFLPCLTSAVDLPLK